MTIWYLDVTNEREGKAGIGLNWNQHFLSDSKAVLVLKQIYLSSNTFNSNA